LTRKYAYLQVPNYTNAEEDVLLMQMETDTAFNVIRYGGGDAARNAVTEHRFFTAANATTLSGTERMRIDSAGNVGIGTPSPAEKLHVVGTGSTAIRIGDTGTARYAELDFGTTNSEFIIGSQGGTPYPIVFQMNAVEMVRIDSAGNVGIGTASPEEQLHIESIFPAILLKDTNGTANSRTTRIATSGSNFVIQGLDDALSSTVDILSANNSTGAVTIGPTVAPVASHVANSGSSEIMRFRRDTTNAALASGIAFDNNATGFGSNYSLIYGYA
jgi:hypothetical protein